MKFNLKALVFGFLVISTPFVSAQSSYIPLNEDIYHLIDRYEALKGLNEEQFHTSNKPYQRRDIYRFFEKLQQDSSVSLTPIDKKNISYFLQDNWEHGEDTSFQKPILKHFYKRRSDFYSVNTKDFQLHANPIIALRGGRESANDILKTVNTRGVEIRGMIDNKVGFYSAVTENQAVLPAYVFDKALAESALPHQAFWKLFKTNGVDYFTARGHLNFNATKHISVTFGHDRNFIGNGYRSLIISDFSSPYLFGKITTKVWKFDYTNIFAQLNADVYTNSIGVPKDGLYPRKHLGFHHLSLNVTKNLNIGLFESIISYRGDSTSQNSFDLNYLNPIIFYRSLEQNIGSEDNALLGMDFKWHIVPTFTLYGQIVLDEFLLKEIKAGNGWWANKQAIQLGGKYINAFGVSQLDLQGEVNVVRPFTYTHGEKTSSYTHYNQPLAHPLGANFKEIVGIARYQPHHKWMITGKVILAQYGLDSNNTNVGKNILLGNTTRTNDYGFTIGNGIDTKLFFGSFTVSYSLAHNIFIDLKHVIRNENASVDLYDSKTSFTSLTFRMNLAQQLHEF